MAAVYNAHLEGSRPLPNSRFVPLTGAKSADVANYARAIDTIATKMGVNGAFNVNSTSKLAWKLVLSGLNDQIVLHRDSYKGDAYLNRAGGDGDNSILVSRFGIAGGPCADTEAGDPNQIPEELFWRGYGALTPEQVEVLAEKIVEQVKLRGPFLSMGEFVNRRLSNLTSYVEGSSVTERELAKRGAVQAALDSPDVTINDVLKNSPINRSISAADVKDYTDYVFPEAGVGDTSFGAPSWVTQGDILKPILSYASPRSDTFMVRAYGESRDDSGEVVATAYCEAVIQRSIDFVDKTNSPDEHHSDRFGNANSSFTQLNREFGRNFKLVRFKWINESEL